MDTNSPSGRRSFASVITTPAIATSRRRMSRIFSTRWWNSGCTRSDMELNDYLSLPYTITLRRDDEGDWIARIQELSGCTAHGHTEAEALERLAEAQREWLSAALADHVSIPL